MNFIVLVKAVVYSVSIPVLAFWLSSSILNNIITTSGLSVSISELCTFAQSINDNNLTESCNEISYIFILKNVSIWTSLAGIGLILTYIISSKATGTNRDAISSIFPKLIPLSIFAIAGLVIVQGGILVYSTYLFLVYYVGIVWLWPLVVVSIGALLGAYALVNTLSNFNEPLIHNEFGTVISKTKTPQVWEMVRKIAKDINAQVPNNIILGLQPNFYATAANVALIDLEKRQNLSGRTLYLSSPLMRILTVQELESIIGHEIGHFSGADTEYSLKFAPLHRGLGTSIEMLSNSTGNFLAKIVNLPAIAILSLMYHMFAINDLAISREREFAADRIGIHIGSKEGLASGLGKVVIYSHLWETIRQNNVNRLNDGKISKNLSKVFQDSSTYDLSNEDLSDTIRIILLSRISHPTNTHPTLFERFENINYHTENLSIEVLTTIGASIKELIPEYESIEEQLTMLEHKFMINLGLVTPSENNTDEFTVLNAIYYLVGSMIASDGKIQQSEVSTAENIGIDMFSEFDTIELRALFDHLDEVPKFTDTIQILDEILTISQKEIIYKYLFAVAEADGFLHKEEQTLLNSAKKMWKLSI